MENRIIKITLIVWALMTLVLIGVVIMLSHRQQPNDQSDELIRSEERVKLLERQLQISSENIKKSKLIEDSLAKINVDNAKQKEYYRKLYYYEKNRVANLPIDSGVVFLAGWLSESDTL